MLNNKTIVVAGAGGLLGSMLIQCLLKSGASVIATDISIDVIKNRLNQIGCEYVPEFITFERLDVTNDESVVRFFKEKIKIDGAVNCSYPRNKTYGKHFFDVSLESFNENLSLHLGSAFLFSQQCAAYFQKHKTPFSLVNISSIYGVVAPKFEIYEGTNMTMPVEYAAIKAAILQLNKYVSSYVSDSKFRVNSVSPGGILDGQPDSFLEKYKEKTNGTGMLDVNDVLGAILFLLSDSSNFMTGQNLVVDDGFSDH
jgi:NAD(P)-dependent dehydrogenase (short-subunit alcohol dehydrogenase family)